MADHTPDEKELKALDKYLSGLKKDEENSMKALLDAFGGTIVDNGAKPPDLDEIREGVSDAEWREKADKAAQYIDSVLESIRVGIKEGKKFPSSFWLDMSVTFLSYAGLIDRDIVYKEQIYNSRIIQIMTDHEMTRLASENYAKSGKEYSEYKNAEKLKERLQEFINLAKYYDRKDQ